MKNNTGLSRLLLTLLMLFFVVLFLMLGKWQLSRAEYKRHLLAAYAAAMQAQPIKLTSYTQLAGLVRYQHVFLSGRYDNEHTILLDNQFYQHQLGYQVYTPFIVDSEVRTQHNTTSNTYSWRILVQRGWIAAPADRATAPVIPPILGLQQITGILDQISPPAMIIGQPEAFAGKSWPLRVASIDLKQLKQHGQLADNHYADVLLRLNPQQPGGLEMSAWTPVVMGPERHVGYAIQWFSFAATLVIIYLILWFYPKTRAFRQGQAETDARS